jgi:hypothetical protein
MPITNDCSVVVSGEFEEEAVEALVIALGGTFGVLESPSDDLCVTLHDNSEKLRCSGLPEAFMITIYDQVQKVLFRKQIFSQISLARCEKVLRIRLVFAIFIKTNQRLRRPCALV